MAATFPRTAPELVGPYERSGDADSLGSRVLAWIRQAYCGLHGHDAMLHFAKDRLYLQCVSCGHRTPGWELNDVPRPATAVAVPDEMPRRAVIRPHLVSARRIA
jgi:hypothetical protein